MGDRGLTAADRPTCNFTRVVRAGSITTASRGSKEDEGRAYDRAVPPTAGRRGGRRTRLAGARTVRPDRPGVLLPREGRVHTRGQEGMSGLRGALRMPGVRPGQRRTLRHLGRLVR